MNCFLSSSSQSIEIFFLFFPFILLFLLLDREFNLFVAALLRDATGILSIHDSVEMLESVRLCALRDGLEAEVLLFALFELFVELDLILDGVEPACFPFDLAHFGQRLVKQLVDLGEHLGAIGGSEHPGRAD